MKGKKTLIPLVAVMLVCCIGILLVGAAGSANDPLISVSYLYQRFTAQLREALDNTLSAQLTETEDRFDKRLDRIAFPQKEEGSFAPQYTWLDLADGEVLELKSFASFVLLRGDGKLMILEGEVLDLFTGSSVPDGSMLTPNHRYLAVEDSKARIRIFGDDPAGMADGYYQTDLESALPLEEQFLDVADGFWAAPFIWRLYEMGVVNGVETHRFAPGAVVTRGAFVTILGRLAGIDTGEYTQLSFTDVQAEDWYGPYVAWAAETGITLGFEDGSFRPGDSISREQLAVMLLRYIRAFDLGLTLEEKPAFTDEASISAWALEAVNALRDAGLLSGRGENRFEPKDTATRAEICAVVCRIADLSKQGE